MSHLLCFSSGGLLQDFKCVYHFHDQMWRVTDLFPGMLAGRSISDVPRRMRWLHHAAPRNTLLLPSQDQAPGASELPLYISSEVGRDAERRASSVVHPFILQTQTHTLWHFGEGSRHMILLSCHPKIKLKKKKEVQVREAQGGQIAAMDSQSAAGSWAQAEGEELLSSRDVSRYHHLPSKSSKPRARLARVQPPRDMVVCPLSTMLEEEPVGNSTVSPRDRGHHGLPILLPVLTLQNNSSLQHPPAFAPPFPPQE